MAFPRDYNDFLILDREQRADLLLAALADCPENERGQNFIVFRVGEWFSDLTNGIGLPRNVPARQAQRREVTAALEDAYAELMSKGLIRPDPKSGNTFCELTGQGREMVDVARLPNGARIVFARAALDGIQLHVALRNRQVDSHFLQGKFETALRDGGVFLEDSIRNLSGVDPRRVGVKLASTAFAGTGRLLDPNLTGAEQTAIQGLYMAFFGGIRNQVAHKDFEYASDKEALQALMLLDYLVEKLDGTAKRLGTGLT